MDRPDGAQLLPDDAETHVEEVSMKILMKNQSVPANTEERQKLIKLRNNIDKTMHSLAKDYGQVQGMNQQLRLQAREVSSNLRRAKSKLRSAHEDLQMCHVRESNLLNFLFKGFKNTLGLIEGHIDQLSGGSVPDEAHSLDQVRGEVHRLWQIVADLATVEAVQLGTTHLQWEQVQLDQLASNVVAEHQQMAKNQSVALNKAIGAGLPEVIGDRQQLKMALSHLVDNAIAHTPDGGSVTILTNGDQSEDWVRMSIVDMRQEALDEVSMHALQGLFPGKKPLHADIAGFDLELMAAWQIISMHRGEIIVDSQAERGTTFTLSLPSAENGKNGDVQV
ncbi:sensor histidine kinase [Candidatus Zixiibacteriota bacterium]